ncbi:MAG: PilZ domain-containing protein [Terriglobales bacterium]
MAQNRQPPEDKRRWKRRPVNVPIRVVADNLAGANAIPGRGTTMSAGGVCVFALANIAIGTQIDVEFIDADSGTPVRARGVVRNRSVYLYGVEFLLDLREDQL